MKFFLLLFVIIPSISFSQKIEVISEKTDTAILFYAVSQYYCDYTVLVQFEAVENVVSSVLLPASFVVPPLASKHFLLSLKQKPNARSWKYKFQYRFDRGNTVNAKHDDSYVYSLPYKSTRTHKMMQGYFGKFSHAKTHSLDFEMPEGTEIIAAREGVVIDVKEDSNIGGLTNDFVDKGNYVLIYHSDGTFASYYHLKINGALVSPGQKVAKGEVIGLSGNTGWSSAPHLHFEVLLPSANNKKTVPTRFLQKDGTVVELKEGNSY